MTVRPTAGTSSAALCVALLAGACWASTPGRDRPREDVAPEVAPADAAGDGTSCSGTWLLRLGGEDRWMRPADIVEAGNGGVVLVGTVVDALVPQEDAWVVRVSADGEVVWQHELGGGPMREFPNGVARRGDGGYVAVGWFGGFGADSPAGAWLIAFDDGGTVAWQRAIAGSGEGEAFDVALLPDGGNVVVGALWESSTVEAAPWVFGLDDDGRAAWQQRYGVEGAVARSVVVTASGAMIAAFVRPAAAAGSFAPVLVRVGDRGEVLWARAVRDADAASFDAHLAALPDGEVALVFGTTLMVFDDAGVMGWVRRIEGSSSFELTDVLSADAGVALVGRDGSRGWLGAMEWAGPLRWQMAVTEDVLQNYAGGLRRQCDGMYVFFGGSLRDTWMTALRADGRSDPACPSLASGDVTIEEGRASLEPMGVESAATSYTMSDQSPWSEDAAIPAALVCAEG